MSKFHVDDYSEGEAPHFLYVRDDSGALVAQFFTDNGATREDAERYAETLNARQPKPRYFASDNFVFDRNIGCSPGKWIACFSMPGEETHAAEFAAKLNAEAQSK